MAARSRNQLRVSSKAEIEDLCSATAAGAFRFVSDVPGAALDAGLGFFVEQVAGRRFRFLTDGFSGFSSSRQAGGVEGDSSDALAC